MQIGAEVQVADIKRSNLRIVAHPSLEPGQFVGCCRADAQGPQQIMQLGGLLRRKTHGLVPIVQLQIPNPQSLIPILQSGFHAIEQLTMDPFQRLVGGVGRAAQCQRDLFDRHAGRIAALDQFAFARGQLLHAAG